MALTGKEKAMILLSILGNELASKILAHLPQEYADLITSSIENLPKPSADAITAVLNDISQFMALEKGQTKRGIEEKPSSERPQPVRSLLDILFYAHPKKIAIALSAERTSVAAFILSFFPNVQAGEVLSFMSERKKEIDMALRSLKKPPISESVKVKLIEILASRIERMAA